MRKIIFFMTLSCYSLISAQDIHLSQFYNADHLLNPAKIGDYDGDYRVSMNYRNQWRQLNKQPISTYVLSFDHLFYIKNHEFDAGIVATSDRFSGSEYNLISQSNIQYNVNSTKIMLGLGTRFNWKNNRFRVGIQSGLVSSSSDPTTQTFPNQWDKSNGDFNKGIPNNESLLRPSQKYIDLNIGTQWDKKLGKSTLKVGLAINHINRPKDSYLKNNNDRLRARKVIAAELFYPLNSSLSLLPKVCFMWTTMNNDMVLGANLKKKTSSATVPSIYGGLFYRHGVSRIFDAIIPGAGFQYKKFDVGLSYDVNVSTLSSGISKRKGTFEMSVIYTGASTMPKKVFLPCDRY